VGAEVRIAARVVDVVAAQRIERADIRELGDVEVAVN
jgi:hypothetical protein